MGKKWEQWQILFSWSPKSLQMVIEATKLRHLLLEERRTKWQTDLDSILKSRDFTLPTKIYILKPKLFGFFSRNVRIWELDQKEGWTLKNWFFWTVVLEKTLRVPWTARRSIQSILKNLNVKNNLVFPVVMYGCESWTIKKAEHRRTDAFELWCWRRLLESLGLQGDPTSPS